MPTSVDPTKNLGPDSTATFESDPTFIGSNPTGNASTENVNVQRDTDDLEDEGAEDGDVDESDEDLEDEDDDEEYDDEDEEEDEDDEDAEEEEADDAEEVKASGATDIPEDQDTGDIAPGINEDDLEDDDLDTDTVTSGIPAASLTPSTPSHHLSI